MPRMRMPVVLLPVAAVPVLAGTKLTPDEARTWREERVPDLTREQVIVELARIVAAIGDGHTYMNLRSPEVGFHGLAVRLYVFRDGLYVLAAKSEHSAIVGGRVVRVGSRAADDASRGKGSVPPWPA